MRDNSQIGLAYAARMPGEEEQEKGRRGAMLAKQWLDRSTRVRAELVNPDGVAKKKLQLKKAHFENETSVFSFDLGGRFRHGDFDGQEFLAECKYYAKSSDLGTHYRAFLAHCYRARAIDHMMADQFFWISFAPHGGTTWDKISSSEQVRNAVLHPTLRNVNFLPNEDPEEEFSQEIADQVSERIWTIILSDKQVEHLILTRDHFAIIEQHIVSTAPEVTV